MWDLIKSIAKLSFSHIQVRQLIFVRKKMKLAEVYILQLFMNIFLLKNEFNQ